MTAPRPILRALIRAIPDYPKPGITFQDITPLLADPKGFALSIDVLKATVASENPTKIAGCEARGFIFGAALAVALGVGFVPIRKKGKLPHKVVSCGYDLEYGTDVVEMHVDAMGPEDRVVLVDDLLATGGTANAAIQLIKEVGATVTSATFLIDLKELGGRKRLEEKGVKVNAILPFPAPRTIQEVVEHMKDVEMPGGMLAVPGNWTFQASACDNEYLIGFAQGRYDSFNDDEEVVAKEREAAKEELKRRGLTWE